MEKNNRNFLFFIWGAIVALFVVETRKEKPFEGLKSWARKLMDNLK